jgi:hypothetical protein
LPCPTTPEPSTALAAAARAIPDRLAARRDLPTGFDLPLWRYVLIDGFAHPTQHLMFHCLKRGHLPLFFSLEQQCRSRFHWFAPDNRSAALCFRDYFPSNADCALFFETCGPTSGTKHNGTCGIGCCSPACAKGRHDPHVQPSTTPSLCP